MGCIVVDHDHVLKIYVTRFYRFLTIAFVTAQRDLVTDKPLSSCLRESTQNYPAKSQIVGRRVFNVGLVLWF